jgi:hypothetical protein
MKIKVPYEAKKAKDMSRKEFSRWFAFMNMVKFVNVGESLSGIKKKEEDIPHMQMVKYVDTVSGDLERCLKEYNGVPYKYSLDTRDAESKVIGEISFE